MKEIILETLTGKITIRLDEPDPVDGRRKGHIQTADFDDFSDPTWTAAMDAIECLVLAHACVGVDVESAAYLGGLNSALEAISNNI